MYAGTIFCGFTLLIDCIWSYPFISSSVSKLVSLAASGCFYNVGYLITVYLTGDGLLGYLVGDYECLLGLVGETDCLRSLPINLAMFMPLRLLIFLPC